VKLKDLWRKNPLRTSYIHSIQRSYLTRLHASDISRAVVFLIPGDNKINGGVISIFSLAEETGKLGHIHNAKTFICTFPGDPPLRRFTRLENSVQLLDLHGLLATIRKNSSVLIHLPEMFVERFVGHGSTLAVAFPEIEWRFNILLQNIDLIPSKVHVEALQRLGTVTCTTAHLAYSNKETEARLGCPVHHFSAWVSPDKYRYVKYEEKENLVILSPDCHPRRKEILDTILSEMGHFKFVTIKKMTYEDYKKLIARAKFSLTFGEGLDGYFAEPILSGGIGSAVYNNKFFTEDFAGQPFVYKSWDDLKNNFARDALSVDNPDDFENIQAKQYAMICSQYSHVQYAANIEEFYKNNYRICG